MNYLLKQPTYWIIFLVTLGMSIISLTCGFRANSEGIIHSRTTISLVNNKTSSPTPSCTSEKRIGRFIYYDC